MLPINIKLQIQYGIGKIYILIRRYIIGVKIMPMKILDKVKWNRTSMYLDILVFLVLIVGIWLIAYNYYLVGFYSYPVSAGTGDESAVNQMGAAIAGVIAGIAVTMVSFVWIFYRYFKKEFRA